jgi:hypothetical protein
MSDYTVTEHNAITNEIVTREMTADEISYIDQQKQIFEDNLAKLASDEAAKNAVLAKLGITQEELKAALA